MKKKGFCFNFLWSIPMPAMGPKLSTILGIWLKLSLQISMVMISGFFHTMCSDILLNHHQLAVGVISNLPTCQTRLQVLHRYYVEKKKASIQSSLSFHTQGGKMKKLYCCMNSHQTEPSHLSKHIRDHMLFPANCTLLLLRDNLLLFSSFRSG